MSDDAEYRCFIGNLSWSTTDRSLKEAFKKFGHLQDAKVVVDKSSDRSRGFGFVTFDEKAAMEEAIEEMNGMDLDGRSITVDKARPNQGSGRDYDDDRNHRDSGRDRGRDREYGGGRGGGRGSGGGDCFRCGEPGHFARECPNGDGDRGGRYGGRDDKYTGGRDDKYSGGRDDKYSGGRDDKYSGGRDDRYSGGRDDRYSGGGDSRGGSRYGPDRNGDRSGGRSRDSGNHGSERHSRDRSGPYDR